MSTLGMSVSVVVLIQALLFAVALNLIALFFISWFRANRTREAISIALLCISASLYCLGYAGEVAQTEVSQAIFWLRIEYLGIPWVPALWLLAARQHNQLPERRKLLFFVPVLTFASQQTNSWHHLYVRSYQMVPHEPFWCVTAERGPFAWLNLIYLYGALLYGLGLYLFGPSSNQYSRLQKLVLASLSLAPLAGYLLYFFGQSPWGLDIAPATLGVTVLAGYFAIFRLGCFEMMPTAHSLVFSNIRDAVLIADRSGQVIDLNPAAHKLIENLDAKFAPRRALPAPLDEVFTQKSDRVLDLEIDGKTRHYEVRVFPLNQHKRHFGDAAILADVSAHIRLVHELRQRAETDPLTGVPNRRAFLAALKQEFATSRPGHGFSIMLVDFDCFKEINDRHGHPAGDKALTTAVKRMLQILREDDLLGRLGGDEFAILLPHVGPKTAVEVAERVRAAVCGTPIVFDHCTLPVSISIGLAPYDGGIAVDWKDLYKAADRALYQAKTAGRNCVSVWDGKTRI